MNKCNYFYGKNLVRHRESACDRLVRLRWFRVTTVRRAIPVAGVVLDSSFYDEKMMLFRCGNWLYYTEKQCVSP